VWTWSLTLATGEKVKQQREESHRQEQNQLHAAAAYRAPDPNDVDRYPEEGLPWGSLSLRHIFAAGQAKEQSLQEESFGGSVSQTTGSSR
jgi:hypothetical protein